MRDSLFFGIASAVAIGMVVTALSLGKPSKIAIQDICETGLVLEGDDLNRLTQVEGTDMFFVQKTASEPAYMVMSAPVSRELAPPSAGIFMSIGEAYANIFNGLEIELIISARQHAESPLDAFEAAYFSTTSGSTPWQRFELSSEFENFRFEHKLERNSRRSDLDYFGIWPGVEGGDNKMDVRSMRVSIISECP